MREGKWTLEVKVDGGTLPEHDVEGRTCVESQPGSAFVVEACYQGSEMHQCELLVDGKVVSGRQYVDGTDTVTFPHRQVTFKGWEKSQDGDVVRSAFLFQETTTAGDNDDDAGSGLASAPADWTRGVITLRVFGGARQMVHVDCNSMNHAPDLRKASAVTEKTMVKGGHSASAGAGDKTFAKQHVWRAGQSFVGRAPDDPLESELHIYYRDSFWLMLRGDKDKVMDAGQSYEAPVSAGVTQARSAARRQADTTARLKRKHHEVPSDAHLGD